MPNWKDKYRSYPWWKDPRAKTFRCWNEGDIPVSAVTGGTATKTGLKDAIAVMIKCLGPDVNSEIFSVLKIAGANPELISRLSQNQTGLRKLIGSIEQSKFSEIQTGFLKICEKYSKDSI